MARPAMVNKLFVFRPNHWTYRYFVLILVCTVKISQNYIYDIPASLEQVIIQTLNIDVSHYTILYSVYSWPNIIFTVIGGILVDRILGKRLGIFLFMVVTTIGQLVMALGGFFDMFWLMVVGRFIIGAGWRNCPDNFKCFCCCLVQRERNYFCIWYDHLVLLFCTYFNGNGQKSGKVFTMRQFYREEI